MKLREPLVVMVLGLWALAGPLRAEGPRWLHKNAKATLEVKSKSAGALVTIDHQAVGVLPHAPFELDAGVHQVALSMEGMKPEERRVSLKGGEQGHITIQLRPLPAPAEPPPLLTLSEAAPGAQAPPTPGQAAPAEEVPLVIVGGELANPGATAAGGEAAKALEGEAK
ncbi:MAG: PEGA domain-containing protein, partial [Deltaproteobacteria bacterium]|nr:PEGA domain-containing protein [Deltaproteobacteria bacterium]